MRESNVVTKVFEVEYVTPPELPPEDDDLEFQEDLEKQKTMVTLSVTFFCVPEPRPRNNCHILKFSCRKKDVVQMFALKIT